MIALTLAPYVSLLVLLYLWLSVHVIRFRYRHRLALGHNGDDAFQRAIRAQANFAEYVPFALILLYLLGELQMSPVIIEVLAVILVVGRISHAYGLIVYEPTHNGLPYFRTVGMVATFTVLTVSSFALLAVWFQFHFAA